MDKLGPTALNCGWIFGLQQHSVITTLFGTACILRIVWHTLIISLMSSSEIFKPRLLTTCLQEYYSSYFESEVSETHFFILETRMRISLIQSLTSRRDREFMTLNLRHPDETEKRSLPISGIETRSRFIIFILRLRDENENSLDLISVFETRTGILKVAIFPWIQAWTASLFCMQFLWG